MKNQAGFNQMKQNPVCCLLWITLLCALTLWLYLCFSPSKGHIPTENSHNGVVFCLHAGEKVGCPPVALTACLNGWSHSCAGTSKQQFSTFNYCLWSILIHNPTFNTRLSLICYSVCLCSNPHSGLQWLIMIVSRRSWLQTLSLWEWWPSWWPASPVASQVFTLRKSWRRPNRAYGSVIYSWVSKVSMCLTGW